MPLDSIYRPDSQPVQRRTFVPIPAQGQAAPLSMRGQVNASQLIAAWVPGPPLPTIPQRRFIAPLTLTYGQQPPPSSSHSQGRLNVIMRAWEPPPPQPTIPQRRFVAPLTLVYGDRPPVTSGARDLDLMGVLVASWVPGPPRPVFNQRGTIAPLTLTYGSQPPPTNISEMMALVRSHEPLSQRFQRSANFPQSAAAASFKPYWITRSQTLGGGSR